MKENIDVKQNVATMHHIERVSFPCPKCGKDAEADVSIILSSYPGQYGYYCPHCGAHGSVLCSEVDEYRFNKKVWDAIGSTRLHGTKCIICGEETTFAGEIDHPHICKNCKEAVIAMRKALGTWHD